MAYQGGDIALDFSPLRQDYYKRQATQIRIADQRRRQQEAITKRLSDLSSKINTKGIRDDDVEPFMNKFKEFKDLSIRADITSDPLERAKLVRQAESKYMELDLDKNISINQKEREKATGTLFSNNPFRVKPEQASKFAEYAKLPVSEIQKRGIDWNVEFKLGARPEVWRNAVKSVFDEVQQEAKVAEAELISKGYIKENGRTYKNTEWVANVLPTTAVAKLQQRYEAGDELREGAEEEAQKLGLTVPQYFNRIVEQNKGSLTFRKQNTPLNVTPPRSSGGGGSRGNGTEEDTFRQQILRGILNKDQKSIDKLLAYLPQGSSVVPKESYPYEGISKGGYNLIRFNIPATYKNGSYIPPVNNLDISLSKGSPYDQLNKIVSDYTGEKISMSKANIEGGKPRGKQVDIKGKPKADSGKSKPSKPTPIKGNVR